MSWVLYLVKALFFRQKVGKMMEPQIKEIWERALGILEKELAKPSFETWIKTAQPVDLEDSTLVIAVPNELARDWVENRYRKLIEKTISTVAGTTWSVRLVANEGNPQREKSKPQAPASEKKTPSRNQKEIAAVGLNPRYNFETFVVGNSNRFAHAAAMAVAESPARAYNPLFIYGGVGLGKTHLMHAIGHYVQNLYPYSKVMYVTSEKFTNDLINSIREDKNTEFRNQYRTIDVLLVDDIQFLAGKERTQEEFFHTFNALYEANKQIVISSDRPPKEIPTLEDRLRSRFEWGLITDIQAPDLETRIAILRKKASLENLELANEVLVYICKQIPSNIRELEGALIRVVAYSTLTNSPITMSLAQEALRDIVPQRRTSALNIDQIQEVVARYFHLDTEEMKAKKRTRAISLPRQVAMYLSRELTDSSLPRIGEAFGGRDHTTVIHACEKVQETMQEDQGFQRTIQEIIHLLQGN